MKISGAIFDMDGTLLDSMYVWINVGVRYVISQGINPGEDLEEKLSNMTMEQASHYIKNEFGIATSIQGIIDGINSMVESQYRDVVLPKSGVVEMLENLKSRGIKMCIATATDLHLAEMALKRTGLMKYFSKIFTCTMVGAGKSSPAIFETALEYLGTPKAETYVFEDALYAIKTAKAAGFPIVGIFDPCMVHDRAKIEALSDYYIVDYSQEPEF